MEMPNPDKPQDMTIAQQYKTNKAAFDRTASEWTAKHARWIQLTQGPCANNLRINYIW